MADGAVPHDGPAANDRGDIAADGTARDATPADAAARRCSWTGAFTLTPPTPLTEINTETEELEPWLTPDGLTLYFARMGNNSFDAFVATRPRDDTPFVDVRENSAINSPFDDTRFAPLADGLSAFFSTNRPGGTGGADTWVIRRANANAPFDPATAAPLVGVNSPDDDWDPFPSADGLRLYWSRTGWPGAGQAIVYAERATPTSAWSASAAVPSLADAGFSDNPSLTADERVILFARHTGVAGSREVFYATRSARDAPFSTPQPVPVINASGDDTEVFVTADGCTVLFGSARIAGRADLDIYRSDYVPQSP